MTNTVNSDDITTLYSVEEAANILQLGLSSTYALLKTGKLKGLEDFQISYSRLHSYRKQIIFILKHTRKLQLFQNSLYLEPE